MRRPLACCTLVAALLASLAVAQAPSASSKSGAAKAKASPVPGYELRTIEGFHVLINKKALDEIEKVKDKYEIPPLEVLENEFKALNEILLPKLVKVLQGVTFWVEWDDTPPGMSLTEEEKARGGRVVAVYRYGSPYAAGRSVQQGTLSHPGKMNAVEVMTLKRLTEMHQPGRDKDQIILLHELCHTVHHAFLGNENPDIKRAYQQAMDRTLYQSAYAKKNDHEYFAEISSAYLDRCNYAPFTASELKDYDPVGYKLCEQVWGKQEVIAKARAKAAAEREAKAKMRRAVAAASGPKPAAPAGPPIEVKVDPEKVAATKLEFARSLLKDGKTDRAKERLKDVIRQHPDTKAAAEAGKLLETL
jgi:hypothetical protein